jgi:hypothetical protein
LGADDGTRGDDDGERAGDGPLDLLTKLATSLSSRIGAAQDALQRLLAVQTDRAQLAIRRRVQLAVVGSLVALAAGTAMIAATIALVRGMAQGLTVLFGGREWLGSIAAAVLCFALVGGAAGLGLWQWNRSQRIKQEAKYAKLRKRD